VKWFNFKPLNLPVTGNIFTGNGKEKIANLPVITGK
jgi:hypothetical protein